MVVVLGKCQNPFLIRCVVIKFGAWDAVPAVPDMFKQIQTFCENGEQLFAFMGPAP